MRFSLSRKVVGIFGLLTVIATITGGYVIYSLHLLEGNQKKLLIVRDFQLQIVSLQSLQSKLVMRRSSTDEVALANDFQKTQDLASKIVLISSDYSFARAEDAGRLPEKVKFFRSAYLELTERYRNELDTPQVGRELVGLLERSTGLVSKEIKLEINDFINTIILVQLEESYVKASYSLSTIREGFAGLLQEIDDQKIVNTLRSLINITDKKLINQLAIRDREEFLNASAVHFLEVSEGVILEITKLINIQLRKIEFIVYLFSFLFVTITVFAGIASLRYFHRFIAAHKLSVTALQQGKYDFELPPVSNDELGDQVRFVKQISVTIRDSIAARTESEMKYRNLVENISDWIWSIDEQGLCNYSSPMGEVVLGVTESEALGKTVLQLFGEDIIHSRAQKTMQQCINENEPFDAFVHYAERNGMHIQLETSGRPVTDSNGNVGFRFVSSDVSWRRLAEEELQKKSASQFLQNQILSLALENLELHEMLDRFLLYLVNAAWLGVEKSGAVFLSDENARSMRLVAHRNLSKEIQKSCSVVPMGVCLCGKAAKNGRVVFAESVDERHEITHPGMHLHGHFCVPIHTVAGEVMGVVTLYLPDGTLRDSHVENTLVNAATIIGAIISRRLAEERSKLLLEDLEARVESRTAQLTAANKELDSFAYTVSHDLRAPLRAIDGFSQALHEDYGQNLDAQGLDFLERVRCGCVRMSNLIDELLNLSRLTRSDVIITPINLSEMAAEVIEEIRAGEPERQADVIIAEGLTLHGDEVMIRAVMSNLLGNAWKYTSGNEQSCIEFGCTDDPFESVFFVRDDGAGFDMKYYDKLFAAFQRLHSSSDYPGSGIGLSTVQRIIHRHQGRIWAEGKIGEGAVFYFTVS